MRRVLIVDERFRFVNALKEQFALSSAIDACFHFEKSGSHENQYQTHGLPELIDRERIDTLLLAPVRARTAFFLDSQYTEAILHHCREHMFKQVVLLSNAAVYHPKYTNPGLVTESHATSSKHFNKIAQAWLDVEQSMTAAFGASPETRLVILRICPSLIPEGNEYFSSLFQRGFTIRFTGFDPSIQLLAMEDLASAVTTTIEQSLHGTFNLSPDEVIPLRKALRLADIRSLPIPGFMQRPLRRFLSFAGAAPIDQVDFLRYSCTVSNTRFKQETGIKLRKTSRQALCDFTKKSPAPTQHTTQPIDDFGLDEDYLRWHGRWFFRFLERIYWRINLTGAHNIPTHGAAILVGIHRGFMPFDGVMLTHLFAKNSGRIPRFLMHPALVKFPFLADFLTKIGGVIACEKNAEIILNSNSILGVFPEGIRGAFKLYKDAYRLDSFGRNDYIRFALRHRAPIVPVVPMGTAEIFPIFARFKWSWWKRQTGWPFFPITPTFPLAPIPLPTKWHIRILPPITFESLDLADTASEADRIQRMETRVHDELKRHFQQMRDARSSIFWGELTDQTKPHSRKK